MSSDPIFKLRDACEAGDIEAARQALEAGAELNPTTSGWNPNFPFLSTAARKGHEALVEFLISKGAKLQTEDAWRMLLGSGQRDIACGPILKSIDCTGSLAPNSQPWGCFFAKLCNQAPAFIDEINKHSPDPRALWNTFGLGETPLKVLLSLGKARHLAHKILPFINTVDAASVAEAAQCNDPVLPILLAKGGNPNARSVRAGNTALHCAAEYDSLDAIRSLAQSGANLESRNRNGLTPLMLCSSLEAVRVMAELGADLSSRDSSGAPALHLLIKGAIQRSGNLGDDNASEHLAALLQLYRSSGQEILCTSASGETAMHALAEVVRTREEVLTLLDVSSNAGLLNQPDLIGITPLMRCIEKGAAYKVLVDAGADLDAVDAEGRTALMQSVKQKFHHVAVSLMTSGAQTRIVDDHGKTALDLAIDESDLRMISALHSIGAAASYYADLTPATASAGVCQRLKNGPFTSAMTSGNVQLMMHVCSLLEADIHFEPDQKDVKRALAIDAKNPDECGAFFKSWLARHAIGKAMRSPRSAPIAA